MFGKLVKNILSYERLTEPLHLNAAAVLVKLFGSIREQIDFDLIGRKQYAYGILKSADYAKGMGIDIVSIIEFGVAFGGGLLNMVEIANKVTKETGIKFNIYGFDTGQGMAPPLDYRDHPNLYGEGDFPMNFDKLSAALPENAKLVIGDVEETVGKFTNELPSTEPIGFVSVDIDYYSSAKNALKIFNDSPEKYLPITVMYFDDIHLDWHNQWCGELLAIKEFNEENRFRKIDYNRFFEHQRIFKKTRWLKHMYLCHILDHPERVTIKVSNKKRTIKNPYLKFDCNVTDFTKE